MNRRILAFFAILITLAPRVFAENIKLKDEGTTIGLIQEVNCVGGDIACTKSGITGIMTISNFAGGALNGVTSIDATTKSTFGTALTFGGADITGSIDGASIVDDSHLHTSASVNSVDISADTNLAVTANEITLTDDTLSLSPTLNLAGKTSFIPPSGATPTLDAAGKFAFDSNYFGASRGTMAYYTGTEVVGAVGIISTDTCTNGQVATFNTGGFWDCQLPSGTGDVYGPASATDNAVARFDTTTGKLLQNSLVTIDDSGNLIVTGTITAGGGTDSLGWSGGILTLASNGHTNNERIAINLEGFPDKAAFTSPTGVSNYDFDGSVSVGGPTTKVIGGNGITLDFANTQQLIIGHPSFEQFYFDPKTTTNTIEIGTPTGVTLFDFLSGISLRADVLRLGHPGTDASLEFYNEAGATDYTVTILPSASQTASYTLKLPPDNGANGYFLQTNGTDTLSWAAPGAPNFGSDLLLSKDNPCIKLDADSSGDTDFWAGVRNDVGADDDDTFQIGDGTTCGTNPWITLTTAGRLGIGTTTPTDSFNAEDANLNIVGATLPSITVTEGVQSASAALSVNANTGVTLASGGGNAASTNMIRFSVCGSADSYCIVERMRITNGGDIGIADSDPDANLEVVNDFMVSSSSSGDGNLFTVLSTGFVGIGVTAPTAPLSIDKGTGIGQVTIDGSSGACLMLRDTDDAGWTECDAIGGVLSCSVDADGVCD